MELGISVLPDILPTSYRRCLLSGWVPLPRCDAAFTSPFTFFCRLQLLTSLPLCDSLTVECKLQVLLYQLEGPFWFLPIGIQGAGPQDREGTKKGATAMCLQALRRPRPQATVPREAPPFPDVGVPTGILCAHFTPSLILGSINA